MKDKLLIISAAILLGVADYFLGGAVSLFFIFGLIVYIIYKNSSPEERMFIITVLIAGFLLRVGFAVLFHAANFVKGYHGISGDDLLYTVKSWALVHQWEGLPHRWIYDLAGGSPKYGWNPFTFILALFYKFFGFHPVTAKFINCVAGPLLGYFTYLTAREMFDPRAARISMLVVTFFPSIMRWSIANLKDPMIMLLFMICLYIIVSALGRKIKAWMLLALFVSMAALYLFPPRLYFILIAASLGLLAALRLFGLLKDRRSKVTIACLAGLGILALAYYFMYVKPLALINIIYECELKQALMAKADFAGY